MWNTDRFSSVVADAQLAAANRKATTMATKNDLFLITGATGNTGAHTVRLLRESGLRVRALVHTPDDRAARLRDLGAEVVQGDLLDFPAVSAATVGVTAAYFNYRSARG
jgi:NAD(P)H dehydrogenase (quinone)